MRQLSYSARVTANNGALVEYLVHGSSAAAALLNLRRARKGDWLRIAVGTGEGATFRALAEVER